MSGLVFVHVWHGRWSVEHVWLWRRVPVAPGTATPCCCFIHPPRPSGLTPVKICMHLFWRECCGKKINQSKTNPPHPPWGKITPNCERQNRHRPTLTVLGKGGPPPQKKTLPAATEDIYEDSMTVTVMVQYRRVFAPLHPVSTCLDVISMCFCCFHVRVWTCTWLPSSVHSALNEAPPPELPVQNIMGNTHFCFSCVLWKIEQKIGCNCFFCNGCKVCLCVFLCDWMNAYFHLFPAVQPHCRGKPAPLYFSLLRLYKHNVKEQTSCFCLAELGGVGRHRRRILQIKVLNTSQLRFQLQIPSCGAARYRCGTT